MRVLHEHGYISHMLSKSQFSRRLQRLDWLLLTLFQVLGEGFKERNTESVYIIDSAPVAICDNMRIRRNQIYGNEAYRGYQASKHRYFYGVKIHLLVTKDHQPVEFFLSSGGMSDPEALAQFAFDLPEGAQVFADKAYNVYTVEERLLPKSIHAVTAKGFKLKVILFVLASSINCLAAVPI